MQADNHHTDTTSKAASREVIVLVSDMVNYSRATAHMCPEEVRDFIISYYHTLHDCISSEDSRPVEIEPLAGDGALVIFDKLPGEDRRGVSIRALAAAIRVAEAIDAGRLPPTRMGLFLGEIIEAQLDDRLLKFGVSFAIATRLQELCEYFGLSLLMDGEIARHQSEEQPNLVRVGKVSLKSFARPIEVCTIYRPGLQGSPADLAQESLRRFIDIKNEAMELFYGNISLEISPDFPQVRDQLQEAQSCFVGLTGHEDQALERILDYIRETPTPEKDFSIDGMRLGDKKRGSLGPRLFRLSGELLRAMNQEFYHALVVDTSWEKYFKLEWHRQGKTIITINEPPDGVYFLDSGEVITCNEKGEPLGVLSSGTIFGEIAYFNKEKKRTATVVAATDVVLRRVSSENFEKMPVIMKIFEQIAMDRL